mmetsp:Transcript_15097/g.35973  ORF Transcript_15097/g.35973 Transcript_15097/m.35973 type:complete len:212 (-) Transcript_15097:279-914(-)
MRTPIAATSSQGTTMYCKIQLMHSFRMRFPGPLEYCSTISETSRGMRTGACWRMRSYTGTAHGSRKAFPVSALYSTGRRLAGGSSKRLLRAQRCTNRHVFPPKQLPWIVSRSKSVSTAAWAIRRPAPVLSAMSTRTPASCAHSAGSRSHPLCRESQAPRGSASGPALSALDERLDAASLPAELSGGPRPPSSETLWETPASARRRPHARKI